MEFLVTSCLANNEPETLVYGEIYTATGVATGTLVTEITLMSSS